MGSYRVDSPPLRNTFDYSWAFPKVVVGRCTCWKFSLSYCIGRRLVCRGTRSLNSRGGPGTTVLDPAAHSVLERVLAKQGLSPSMICVLSSLQHPSLAFLFLQLFASTPSLSG